MVCEEPKARRGIRQLDQRHATRVAVKIAAHMTENRTALEPYAQLVKALLPRAHCVCVFDAAGELRWSSETTTGPDLASLVEDALASATIDSESAGQTRLLDGVASVNLFWMRDDAQRLVAAVAVVCREGSEPHAFPFTHGLLKPALECLRRELLSRSSILDLHRTLRARSRDLELLMSVQSDRAEASRDGADELRTILKRAAEHLKCALAALIVPEKSLVLMQPNGSKPPGGALLARLHRQLLSLAQTRREPLIINRLVAAPDQTQAPYRMLCCPLRHPSGRIMGVLTLFRPETSPEFIDHEARLTDLLARKAVQAIEAGYDATSGLLTRTTFEQRAAAAIAGGMRDREPATPWSLLYIDVDLLHVVNESFGMHVGDSVIAQLGELIRRRLAPGALASRISGDRFAVLLPMSLEDAAQFGDSLREGAEQVGRFFGDARLRVSISVGGAEHDARRDELVHTLAAAESACKAAKDRGRNRVEISRHADASIVRRYSDINLSGALREAIAQDRLRLVGQLALPLGALRDSRPHFELLLRMVGEDGRTVGPDDFLSAANRYQLMPEIDRWVVRRAIELLQPHAEILADRPVTFALNLSGQSIGDENFETFLVAALESSGLDPAIFCFELTESAAIANIERAEVLMRRLRRLGCGVALDDFGTGLSSLAYLRALPVTMLKIDGSFVRDVLKDPRAESLVQAIAKLARGMGLVTVAEYVETDEILTRIAALDVDYGQGFAIGRPTPLPELLADLPVLAAASQNWGHSSTSEIRDIA